MDVKNILAHCDHTLLKQESTWAQIKEVCDDGLKYGCASVCIPASFVKQAADYVGNELKICTVIGFPNGYSTTAVKVFETEDAIRNGADEIDMVINIGWLKDREYDRLRDEIRQVKAACAGRILKVIIETCLLSEEEKVRMCGIVTEAGADFIKTSTGFSTAGATFDDIRLFAEHVGEGVRMKAAGGIKSFGDAEEFIRIVKLAKAEKAGGQTAPDSDRY